MTADLSRLDPAATALLLVDMQNDFLHPQGAYARADCTSAHIADMIPRLVETAKAVRAWGGWTVATMFTLVAGKDGAPFVAPHLKALRPFLDKGDFAPGSWGQDAIADLAPIDMKIEKVAYNAFHQSRLEFSLRKAGIRTLLVGGIVTNGGLASTLRGAHVLEFETVLLSHGCGAFKPDVHDVTVRALSAISPVATCADVIRALRPR